MNTTFNYPELSFETRTEIFAKLISEFNLPDNIISRLHKHYLLHWTGEYFQELYYKRGAMITHQSERYLVLWYDHDIRPVMAATKLALSFRKLSKSDDHGFVIVRGIEFPNSRIK